jgi:hypothetical protein
VSSHGLFLCFVAARRRTVGTSLHTVLVLKNADHNTTFDLCKAHDRIISSTMHPPLDTTGRSVSRPSGPLLGKRKNKG